MFPIYIWLTADAKNLMRIKNHVLVELISILWKSFSDIYHPIMTPLLTVVPTYLTWVIVIQVVMALGNNFLSSLIRIRSRTRVQGEKFLSTDPSLKYHDAPVVSPGYP